MHTFHCRTVNLQDFIFSCAIFCLDDITKLCLVPGCGVHVRVLLYFSYTDEPTLDFLNLISTLALKEAPNYIRERTLSIARERSGYVVYSVHARN